MSGSHVLSSQHRLDVATRAAGEAFLNRIGGKYAPLDALIFGSRARGDHRSESDVDIAVILPGPPGDRGRIGMDMAGIAVDVLLETGVLVSPLPLWENELQRPDTFSNPALIEAIKREGMRL